MRRLSLLSPIPALLLACWTNGAAVASDPFRSLPLEGASSPAAYRVVDASESTVVVVRDRAEYASVALRAAEIASRMNGAVENLREHGSLLVLADWSRGRPILHQASRDGTVDYAIARVVPEDLDETGRRGDAADLVQLTRKWLDRIDAAIEAAVAADRPPSAEEPAPAVREPVPAAAPVAAPPASAEPPVSVVHPVPLGESAVTTTDLGVASPPATPPPAPPPLAAPTQATPSPPEPHAIAASDSASSGIWVSVDPTGSVLYVDGKMRSVASGSFDLAPGEHLVEIIHPAYKGFRKRVQVQEGQFLRMAIALEKDQHGQ